MKLEELLSEHRLVIQKKWLRILLETYPDDTQRFFKKQKDRFANPVGHIITKEIENLFKGLLRNSDPETVSPILDRIIRIRAVQDFPPSRAVSFIFPLKKIIREEMGKEILENRLFDELLIFEKRIDELALHAFDIYVKCKEKLYEIRANQSKNQVSRLLIKAGLMTEIPAWEPNPKEDTK